jgi:hypothetical protein
MPTIVVLHIQKLPRLRGFKHVKKLFVLPLQQKGMAAVQHAKSHILL